MQAGSCCYRMVSLRRDKNDVTCAGLSWEGISVLRMIERDASIPCVFISSPPMCIISGYSDPKWLFPFASVLKQADSESWMWSVLGFSSLVLLDWNNTNQQSQIFFLHTILMILMISSPFYGGWGIFLPYRHIKRVTSHESVAGHISFCQTAPKIKQYFISYSNIGVLNFVFWKAIIMIDWKVQ